MSKIARSEVIIASTLDPATRQAGKFALRGLAQSLARELSPQGIHVGHVIVDGGIRPPGNAGTDLADDRLDPDAIAATYLHLLRQPRSAWTWEIEVRPWVEKF